MRYGDGLVDEKFFLSGFEYFRQKYRGAVFVVVSNRGKGESVEMENHIASDYFNQYNK